MGFLGLPHFYGAGSISNVVADTVHVPIREFADSKFLDSFIPVLPDSTSTFRFLYEASSLAIFYRYFPEKG
jgi:hypothetical protein